jgi:hypothetical protein
LVDEKPIVGFTRPVPFKLRPVIRDQINQMMKDGILEFSDSPFINPLTVVPRKGS